MTCWTTSAVAMQRTFLLLCAVASAQLFLFSTGVSVVYVGTGGCDGTDVGCVDDVYSEKSIKEFHVSADGKMIGSGMERTPGNPIWLTKRVQGPAQKQCLFATVADKNRIYSRDSETTFSPTLTPSGGVNPVYAQVARDGKVLLVANYHGPDDANTSTGAGVASFTVDADCSLTLADVVPHAGHSADPSRQGGAHVHSFVPVSSGGSIAFACDLGQDLIFTYEVSETGQLRELHRARAASGSGPRHIAVHPEGRHIYVVSEMGMTVSTYEVTTSSGALELKQELSLVAEHAEKAGSKAAEIAILPDGSAVYATNRGALNTVTTFHVLPSGLLRQVQQLDTVRYPRGMIVIKGGQQLLIAQQAGPSKIVSYDVGPLGMLTFSGNVLEGDALPPHPATMVELVYDGKHVNMSLVV